MASANSAMARWGMASPAFTFKGSNSDPGTTNIRNLASLHWCRSLGAESRCIVPFTSFSENEVLPEGSGAGLVRARREPTPGQSEREQDGHGPPWETRPTHCCFVLHVSDRSPAPHLILALPNQDINASKEGKRGNTERCILGLVAWLVSGGSLAKLAGETPRVSARVRPCLSGTSWAPRRSFNGEFV
jgi:hypothetical protein